MYRRITSVAVVVFVVKTTVVSFMNTYINTGFRSASYTARPSLFATTTSSNDFSKTLYIPPLFIWNNWYISLRSADSQLRRPLERSVSELLFIIRNGVVVSPTYVPNINLGSRDARSCTGVVVRRSARKSFIVNWDFPSGDCSTK